MACEVLVPTPAVRNLIREGKTHQIYSVLQTGSALGMQTMDTALAGSCARARSTQKLAEARSSTPEELRRLLGSGSFRGGIAGAREHLCLQSDRPRGKQGPWRGGGRVQQAVADQLKARGLVVLDVVDKHNQRDRARVLKRVPLPDLAVFSRQLATMITSGMSILRALYVLEEQTIDKLLKETIVAIRKDVEAGLALSESMARHSKVFSPLYVAMVKAGETGGVLESSLVRVADQLEKDASLRKQIRSAMVYPVLVISFALIVLIAMVAFVIPVFVGVFKNYGGELPMITQISVGASNAVTHAWYAIILGTIVLVFSFLKWKRSSWGRKQWDRFKLHIPMKIGSIVQEVALARWSRTLSSLTGAGVPLLQALEIVGRDRRQHCDRGGDGRGDRLGEARTAPSRRH